MSTRGVLFLLLGIFFLAGAAAAATDLTHSTMTSSNTGWIVANGKDQATITVHVTDGASDLNGQRSSSRLPTIRRISGHSRPQPR